MHNSYTKQGLIHFLFLKTLSVQTTHIQSAYGFGRAWKHYDSKIYR